MRLGGIGAGVATRRSGIEEAEGAEDTTGSSTASCSEEIRNP